MLDLNSVGKLAMIASLAFFILPILLLVFGIFLARTARKAELASQDAHVGWWLFGISAAGLGLLIGGGVARLAVMEWSALGLFGVGLALCGWLLWGGQVRPLRVVTRALFADLFLIVVFLPFALWLANESVRAMAYSNTNEAEVRAALTKNPDDAAAHSSLAQIDHLRRDRAGEIVEWRQVLRVEPDNLNALILLSGKLSQDGRIEEARPLFQRLAARHDDFSAGARRWLVRHSAP